MTVWETIFSNLITMLISYKVGRNISKTDKTNAINSNNIEKSIDSIRSLTNIATRYFTSVMDEKERDATTGIIRNELRRISCDIASIHKNSQNKDNETYTMQYRNYYNCITEEPFGDTNFQVVNSSDQLISSIQSSEEYLITVLRNMIVN